MHLRGQNPWLRGTQDELSHVAARREVAELTEQLHGLKQVLIQHAAQVAASDNNR